MAIPCVHAGFPMEADDRIYGNTRYHLDGAMRIGISFAETTNGLLHILVILQKRRASQCFSGTSLFLPMVCLDTIAALPYLLRTQRQKPRKPHHTIIGSMLTCDLGWLLPCRASTLVCLDDASPACSCCSRHLSIFYWDRRQNIFCRMPRARGPFLGRRITSTCSLIFARIFISLFIMPLEDTEHPIITTTTATRQWLYYTSKIPR